MLKTVADDIWGKPCLAYHVQPHLEPATQAALSGLRRDIAGLWPAPLHIGPPEALHVTIYALAMVKADYDKQAYWARIAEPSRRLLEDLCAGHPALDLHFSQLKVTDTAIIATARDETGLIEAVRRKIAEEIPPPPGQKPLTYDLIHTTLARYPSAIEVPRGTVERIESLPVSIHAPVRRLKIISETLFPCQAVDEIASFPLR
jgi:hypothetical protein